MGWCWWLRWGVAVHRTGCAARRCALGGLFALLAALHLFSTTAMGIFLATLAQHAAVRHAADTGAAAAATAVGRQHAAESMPQLVQDLMLAAPPPLRCRRTGFIYRGAGWT
jgi:ABC-2 type transport system permease protein